MNTTNANNPNYTNGDYAEAVAEMTLVQDVIEGSRAVRKKGQEYLPKYFAERMESYNLRLKIASLFPATQRTWQGLVGMAFRKEIKLGQDVPVQIRGVEADQETAEVEGHWENIDLQGTHGSVFAQHVFELAVRDGHAAVLVDAPPLPEQGNNAAGTLTQADTAGWRPYWVAYEKCQILLPIRTTVENGRLFLQQIRFKEESTEPDGAFGETEVCRVRVLERTGQGKDARITWRLYRKIGDKDEWMVDDEGVVNLPEIPVAFFYTRKEGVGESCPPLTGLAELNLRHYRLSSNHEKALTLCVPIPVGVGINNAEKQITIGTEDLIKHGPEGKFYFAEPAGTSLKPTAAEIEVTENWMAKIGLSLLEPKPATGPQTATETILDSLAEMSELALWVKYLKDGIERCLGYHAAYLGEPSGGSVEIGATSEQLTLAPDKLRVLSDMVEKDQFPLDALWALMERGGDTPEHWKPETALQAIEKSKAAKAAQFAATQATIGANALKAFDAGAASNAA